jgi:hypothetical protein
MTTFWIALYGAVLSTVLFIRSLSEGWPRLILQRSGDDIVVSLKNEGKHSLIVHRLQVLGRRLKFTPSSSPSTRRSVRTALNMVNHGDLQIIVPPDGNKDFRLMDGKPAPFYICWLIWNSARLRILPRLPLFFVISKNQLETLKRSAH